MKRRCLEDPVRARWRFRRVFLAQPLYSRQNGKRAPCGARVLRAGPDAAFPPNLSRTPQNELPKIMS